MVLDCVVCSVPFAGYLLSSGFIRNVIFAFKPIAVCTGVRKLSMKEEKLQRICTRCCVCVIQMRWCGEVPWWRSSFDGALVVDVRGV